MGVTRQELYDQIWSEPISKVAKLYEVSDSFLNRILKRLNIPKPPQGYWAKQAAGKNLPRRPDLPKSKPGDELEWCREYEPATRLPFEVPVDSGIEPSNETYKRVDRKSQHPLLKESLQYFKDVPESELGYLKPIKKNLPDFIVTKATLDRTFKLANDLFTKLHSKGHRVLLAHPSQHLPRPNVTLDENEKEYLQHPGIWSPGKPTLIYVGNIPLGLTIFETTTRLKVEYIKGQYVPVKGNTPMLHNWMSPADRSFEKSFPSGKLSLRIYAPSGLINWIKEWREEPGKSLQELFPLIISGLIDCAKSVATMITDAEHEYEIQNQKWAAWSAKFDANKAKEKYLKALQESKEELSSIIQAWNEIYLTEDFLQHLESILDQFSPTEKGLIVSRIAAARAQASNEDVLKRFFKWKNAEERLKFEDKEH